MKVLASVIGNLALVPRKPGTYLGRDGVLVVLSTQGTDGRWHGHIPGDMTYTWWYANGRHGTFLNHDLVALVEE